MIITLSRLSTEKIILILLNHQLSFEGYKIKFKMDKEKNSN